MPMKQRVPKLKGFNNPFRVEYHAINLDTLQELSGIVDGGVIDPQVLIEHGLFDELRLMVHPVVVGAGRRLFGELSDKKPLRLVGTRTVGDGVVILAYKPIRHSG